MGLDAYVYCDCFEKDNLRCNPPAGLEVRVEPSGDLSCAAASESEWFAFAAWKRAKACLHPGMILVHHRLGSTAVIDLLRTELEKHASSFPILVGNILYSGTHTCDWIPFRQIPPLTEELKALQTEEFPAPVSDPLRLFKIQVAELIIAAQLTRKPICF